MGQGTDLGVARMRILQRTCGRLMPRIGGLPESLVHPTWLHLRQRGKCGPAVRFAHLKLGRQTLFGKTAASSTGSRRTLEMLDGSKSYSGVHAAWAIGGVWNFLLPLTLFAPLLSPLPSPALEYWPSSWSSGHFSAFPSNWKSPGAGLGRKITSPPGQLPPDAPGPLRGSCSAVLARDARA